MNKFSVINLLQKMKAALRPIKNYVALEKRVPIPDVNPIVAYVIFAHDH